MSENKTNENAATEQELSELLQIRRDKLKALQDEGRDPFTQTRFVRSAYSTDIKNDYESFDGKTVKVAGRMMSKRGMGKAIFCHIKDDRGTIQLYIRKDAVSEQEFADFRKYDIGDIIGVTGFVFKTKTEEISVHVESVMLLSKTFDIVMAVFDVGSHVVTQAASSISGSTSLDVEATLTSMFNSQIDTMGIGELIGLGLETMVISLCMKIMSVLITVILYGRMIEIYLYVSVAPIPAATVTNREWGTIGTNYLKGLVALAFQGFFIMVCVAIYAVLVAGVAVAGNLHSALWSVAAYTVILCFSLFKTGSLSKSIFNAH